MNVMPMIQRMKKSPIFSPILRRMSYFLRPYLRHRFEIIEQEKINVALDVGACVGDFGIHLRHFGYKKRLISFEPVQASYSKLIKQAEKDPLWECKNYALGDEEKTARINVLNCGPGSSFLETTDLLLNAYGSLMQKQKEEEVQVKRLDRVLSELCKPTDSIFLKIDTQGFEKQVLEGAGDWLKQIRLVYLEVSLIQVYKNEPTMSEILDFMESKGFTPVIVELEEWHKKSMRYFQVDVLFRNTAAIA